MPLNKRSRAIADLHFFRGCFAARCKGIVILSDRKPIVMVAVDWIGIASSGQTVFKETLARAAGTDPTRVVVHTLHQYDAPRCDFAAEELTPALTRSSVRVGPNEN